MKQKTTRDVKRDTVDVAVCQPVMLPYPGHRTKLAARFSKASLLALLAIVSSVFGIPLHLGAAPASGNMDTNALGTQGSQFPQRIGAGPLPDLALPHTVVSSIDTLIGAGGVKQASADNLLLYNLAVRMRLFGGKTPHDELLGPDMMIQSPWSFWQVEALVGNSSIPLVPSSNSFTILGTNAAGTSVVRTMTVGTGPYSGTLRIIYKATSAGPLKWDLDFVPNSAGHYRLVFIWQNIPNQHEVITVQKRFNTGYSASNYTFVWNDIPDIFNAAASVTRGWFTLAVDLGSLTAGNNVQVDPSVVGSSSSQQATAYSFQRKVFYEPTHGNYFVLYYDGAFYGYRSSHDGINWSSEKPMPPGWPNTTDLSLFFSGQTVGVVGGTTSAFNITGKVTASLVYATGILSGSQISWQQYQGLYYQTLSNQSYSSGSILQNGFRYVNVALSSTGIPAFSFNYWYYDQLNSPNYFSSLYVAYNGGQFSPTSHNGDTTDPMPGHSNGAGPLALRSLILPEAGARVLAIYQSTTCPIQQLICSINSLNAQWFDGTNIGPQQPLDCTPDNDYFSAVSDSSYAIHILYPSCTSGDPTYAYQASPGSSWTLHNHVFPSTANSTALTVDYSTNDLYAFAVEGSSIVMRIKKANSDWGTVYSPIVGRKNPAFLTSNFASISASNSSQVSIVWTEGPGPFNVTFAAVPIQTVWSPFSSPGDPWDGNGIAPYGQYFANLGESVSTSTGMLTIRQTDLSVPGRGMNLDITRVYTEPYSFLNGVPYNYETYPWAPMGNGWQLNFPWMNNTQSPNKPSVIHLWDGEGYRIPTSFWSTGVFENHQGEHFRLIQNSTAIFLYASTGTSYKFDGITYALVKIVDAIGNNITLSYAAGKISSIIDTVGRNFVFCYTGNFLTSVQQSGSSCVAGFVRRILYTYSGQSLTNVTDPDNRVTSYSYSSNPWLLTRITFPTRWYDSYVYVSSTLGTQATSYRVFRQLVNATQGAPVRRFEYNYTQGPGDPITASTVRTYNGTQLASITDYSYSFAGVTWNVSTASHQLIRGVQQRFGVHGEIPREIILVSTTQGYTNYYRYDLWGNMIYSRTSINPSAKTSHETFHAYYNNGLPVGFNAFQETFSQNQGTSPDNQWSTYNGTWLVNKGVYNGTSSAFNPTYQEQFFAWTNFTSPNISMIASIYITKPMGSYNQEVGLISHYSGNWLRKWTLVLHNATSGTRLSLRDEAISWVAESPCTISYNKWYRFNFTINGNQAWGSATAPGISPCSVAGSFTSNDITLATGIGLFAGEYSTLFDNVTVTTVTPAITGTSFSNAFINNGSPSQNIHAALAGTAEFQNGTGSAPIETYYGYTTWGDLNQTRHMYNSPTGVQWLVATATYDSYGNKLVATDPLGQTTYLTYSTKFNSAFLTNKTRLGATSPVTSLYGYNLTMGTMIWARDPNRSNVTYKYDILGRLVNVTYPNKDFTAYSYNDQANYVDIMNENGWKTRQIYDGLGRLSITDRFLVGASYSNETYTYNWQDEKTSNRDPLGNLYTYQYDALGRLILTTKPDGNLTKIAYDSVNSWAIYTDEYSNTRCSISDRLGRLVSVIEYSDANCNPQTLSAFTYVTNYYYDEVGNLARVSNAQAKSTSYSYDNLNRLTKTTYSDGSSESCAYDNDGNLLVKTDRKAAQTTYVYDPLNRVTTITYASMGQDTYSYDPNSNLSQLNSQNATIAYVYDSRNRVTSESYSVNPAQGGSVAYGTLITLANRTSVAVQNLRIGMNLLSYNVTSNSYVFSILTRLNIVSATNMLVIRTQDPLPLRVDNATAQRLYIKTVTGWTGWLSVTMLRVGDYLFNALDRQWTMVTSVELAPAGTHIMYDIYTTAPGNYIANGYLDPHKNGPVSLSSSSPVPSSYTINYAYSGEALSTITYPDGFVAKYSFDSLGRMLNVTRSGTSNYYARFSSYQNDEIRGVQYGNGLSANYTYNKLGLVARTTLNNTATSPPTPLLILNYQYNRTATVASVTGNSTDTKGSLFTFREQYRYDPLQRLNNSYLKSGATVNTISYSYNNLGDRIQQTLNGQATSYVYNATNDELAAIIGGWSYSYDGNGNLKTKTQGTTNSTFVWDSANRLVKASNNNVLVGAYGYDGLGRRVESVESSTIFYAYYGTETLSELVSGGATTAYLYAGGLRIGRVSGNTVNYYHTDQLGSTRLVTDSSNTPKVLFSDNYQPFGQDNLVSGSETYKFTGKPVSQTTGLYYDYQRWYDPSIGRFISTDPKHGRVSNPQTLNPYIYVQDRPTSLNDPTGECPECLIGAVAGGAIAYSACVAGGGGFTWHCAEEGLVGAAVGALAGLTFGLSLSFTGTSIAGFLGAGAISGTISGIATFDLKAALGLEEKTFQNFIADTTSGFLSGLLGGALSFEFGGGEAESMNIKQIGSDLEKTGSGFVQSVSRAIEGEGAAAVVVSKRAAIIIGATVELGQAVGGEAIDNTVHFLASVFSSTSTSGPTQWRDIGNHRG